MARMINRVLCECSNCHYSDERNGCLRYPRKDGKIVRVEDHDWCGEYSPKIVERKRV